MKHLRTPVFPTEQLRVHPLDFTSISLCLIDISGQNGQVGMIGHNSIDDDNHILPSGANDHTFHQRVTILIVFAYYSLFQSFITDVERKDGTNRAVRQPSGYGPYITHQLKIVGRTLPNNDVSPITKGRCLESGS